MVMGCSPLQFVYCLVRSFSLLRRLVNKSRSARGRFRERWSIRPLGCGVRTVCFAPIYRSGQPSTFMG
jgi:hypothetical protein